MTIAATVALTLFDLIRALPVRSRVQRRDRDRLRRIVPFLLAIAIVGAGTLLYLELVGVMVTALE